MRHCVSQTAKGLYTNDSLEALEHFDHVIQSDCERMQICELASSRYCILVLTGFARTHGDCPNLKSRAHLLIAKFYAFLRSETGGEREDLTVVTFNLTPR